MAGGIHGHATAGTTNTSLETVHDDLTTTNSDLAALNSTQTDALTAIQDILSKVSGEGSISLTSDTVAALETAFTSSLSTNHTDLQTIAGDLSDVHSRLLDMFEQGQLVGLEPADMTTLATAIATLFHYPTDYPSAQANTDATSIKTKLDTGNTNTTGIRTDLGTDGTSPPTVLGSGTGVRGWLRSIYEKLTGTIAVTGTFWQATQPVDNTKLNGTTVDTNSGNKSAGTQRIVIATDQPNLTTPLNTTLTDGTQTANTAAGDANNNALITGGGIKTTSIASASAIVDCSYYKYVSFQLIGTTFNVTPQQSSDNSTWKNCPSVIVSSIGNAPVYGALANAPDHYVALLGAKYFRLLYTSGTVTGSIVQSTHPFLVPAGSYSFQAGTWTVQQGNTPASTPWLTGGTPEWSSLTGATSVVAGSAKNPGMAHKDWTMQVIIGGTGSLSASTVLLEGSNNGTDWWTIGSYTGTVTGIVTVLGVPATRFRANCTVRTVVSGTPTVTAVIAATH